MSPPFCCFLHPLVTSSLLGLNILFMKPFPNSYNFRLFSPLVYFDGCSTSASPEDFILTLKTLYDGENVTIFRKEQNM